MRLFDLLYGMRMGQPPQQFQAPGMSTPTPPQPYGDPNSAGGQFSTGRSWMTAPGMSAPQQFQPPGMSTPQPPMPFQPPSMSQPTPPQAFGQQGFGQARGLQTAPGLQGRFQSPEHNRAGWMGARAPWSFEP